MTSAIAIGTPAVLPQSAKARRYVRNVLCLPRSRRERFLNALHLWQPALTDVRDEHALDDSLVALLFSAINGAFARKPELRCVVSDRNDQDGRRRLLAFIFDGDATQPLALAKAQHDKRNGSLAAAAKAIESVRGLMSHDLRDSVTRVLHVSDTAEGEVLITSGLPGRSAYAELALSLAPSLHAERHFETAARWLASFHEASRIDVDSTAAHGDYWAHNVLLDGSRISVVDWEHFNRSSSRYVDLFFYALTYGMSFPWQSYARVAPELAFRKTFLETNRVSRALRAYLHTYAARTGVAHARLRDAFSAFLETHGTMRATSDAHPGVRALPWGSFAAAFSTAKENVFS